MKVALLPIHDDLVGDEYVVGVGPDGFAARFPLGGLVAIPAGLGTAALLDSDTDASLAANSDSKLATQRAVKAYVDAAVTGLLDFKGSTDCSANPNYPAASKGDAYIVSAAGKIGGAAGVSVDIGDVYVARADNAGGTQAVAGASWFILEHNLAGVLLAANNLSDLPDPVAARTSLGLGTAATLDSDADGALAANSDTRLATQKAVKTYVDAKAAAGGTEATNSEVWTGADTGKFISPRRLFAANASQALIDGATITIDGNTGFNFHVTLGGNRTLANPTNMKAGQSGRIRITQDGTGSRLMTFGTNWQFAGGDPTLSTAAQAIDVIAYYCHSSTEIEATFAKALA